MFEAFEIIFTKQRNFFLLTRQPQIFFVFLSKTIKWF